MRDPATTILSWLTAAGGHMPERLPVLSLPGAGFDNAPSKRAAGAVALGAALLALPGLAAPLAAVPAYLAGTLVPDMLLSAAGERERRAVDAELPALAELIAVMATAGLNPSQALPLAAAECAGPLRQALDVALAGVALGVPRRQALQDAAAATPSDDFRRLADLLADADRFGLPLGETMRRWAAELRDKQTAAMREEAQKLPVKMLFPLVFMILPAFILLTAGPLFLTMT